MATVSQHFRQIAIDAATRWSGVDAIDLIALLASPLGLTPRQYLEMMLNDLPRRGQ